MGSSGVQIVCVALGVVGLIGTIVCCTVPLWKVSSFVGSNILTAQNQQQGLWMDCVVQSTGQQQCKNYDSLLDLSSDLQAARAMTVISIMFCSISLLVVFCGADFTTCVQNEGAKPKLSLAAGVGLLLAGLLVIIPVSWSANITVRNFNDPTVPASMKREMGACIYVGWASGVLLLLAGGLLCCFSRPRSSSSAGTTKYYSNSASAPAANKNYV
uniref:Claudin n=1 Tax=Nothobranchius korthausae TaxID=1143690 RepID=A0A1A8FX48_9TELE